MVLIPAFSCVVLLKSNTNNSKCRTCKQPDSAEDQEKEADADHSKCIPLSIKSPLSKQPRNETMKSPVSKGVRISSAGADASKHISHSVSNGGSKRITEPSSGKRPSKRLDSFREEEKVIKIEES